MSEGRTGKKYIDRATPAATPIIRRLPAQVHGPKRSAQHYLSPSDTASDHGVSVAVISGPPGRSSLWLTLTASGISSNQDSADIATDSTELDAHVRSGCEVPYADGTKSQWNESARACENHPHQRLPPIPCAIFGRTVVRHLRSDQPAAMRRLIMSSIAESP